jgi:hypothetical protein
LLSEHHKDKNIRYVLSDSWLNDEEFLNYFHNYYREKTGKESRIWKVLQETKKYVADNGGELQLTPIHPKKYEEKKAKRIRPNTFLAQALEAYEKEGHKLQE